MQPITPKRRGRPPMPEDQRQTERREVRMTVAEAAEFDRLGGAKWMRARIRAARKGK